MISSSQVFKPAPAAPHVKESLHNLIYSSDPGWGDHWLLVIPAGEPGPGVVQSSPEQPALRRIRIPTLPWRPWETQPAAGGGDPSCWRPSGRSAAGASALGTSPTARQLRDRIPQAGGWCNAWRTRLLRSEALVCAATRPSLRKPLRETEPSRRQGLAAIARRLVDGRSGVVGYFPMSAHRADRSIARFGEWGSVFQPLAGTRHSRASARLGL